MTLAFQSITNNELGFFTGASSHNYREGAPLDAGSQAAHNPVLETILTTIIRTDPLKLTGFDSLVFGVHSDPVFTDPNPQIIQAIVDDATNIATLRAEAGPTPP